MAMRFAFRGFRFALLALGLLAASLLGGCGAASVTPPAPETPLDSLSLSVAIDTLVVPNTVAVVAFALDTNSVVVSNPTVHWSSSDAGVASVNSAGVVTAVGDGVAWIRGASGGKSDSVRVFVYTVAGWAAQASGTTNNLNGVHFTSDGRNGWAVGDAGTILRTSNAGASWAAQASNTSFALNSVWFVSSTTGYAAGDAGTLMRTTNGGTTWTRLTNVGTSANLKDVQFVNAAYGWAVGANGAIARTRNGGATWDVQNPTTFQLHSVAFSDTSNGWAVGDNGVILGTRDAGASWFVTPSLTSQSLRGASRPSVNNAWAAGQAGVAPFARFVGTPTDSVQWALDNVGAANQLEGVHFPTLSTGYMVGYNGTGIVLKTQNGGTTWSPQVANSAQRLNDVWFADAERGWAVGDGGRIVHTGRGGE